MRDKILSLASRSSHSITEIDIHLVDRRAGRLWKVNNAIQPNLRVSPVKVEADLIPEDDQEEVDTHAKAK